MTIPTYSADGRRLGNRRPGLIQQLLEKGLVIVHRTRKGVITCAQFLPAPGVNPVQSIPTGQSYWELLPSGRHAWKFVSERVEDENDQKNAEKFIYAVYNAVPLSISGGSPIRRQAARIRQKKRTKHFRPVEFDSQMRIQ